MEELAKLIAEAAQGLGIAAERIWPQMVYITFITSLFWLVTHILLLVGESVLIAKLIGYLRGEMKKVESDGGFYALVAVALLGMAAFISIACLPNVLAGVLAPEAVTVLDLIKKATGK